MKKTLKSILKILGIMLVLFMIIFVPVYIAIYLTGIWRVEIGGVRLSFEPNIAMAVLPVYASSSGRSRIGKILSASEAGLGPKARKQRRYRLRLIFCMIWFMVYGSIFAMGQVNHWHDAYAHLGSLNWFDFGLVCLYGIVLSTVIPTKIPKPRR